MEVEESVRARELSGFLNVLGNSLGDISSERVVLGCVTVLLLAEASRRLVGWPLVIIAACFLLYAVFAYIFPGEFYGRGWTISRLDTYLYLDANGISARRCRSAPAS